MKKILTLLPCPSYHLYGSRNYEKEITRYLTPTKITNHPLIHFLSTSLHPSITRFSDFFYFKLSVYEPFSNILFFTKCSLVFEIKSLNTSSCVAENEY